MNAMIVGRAIAGFGVCTVGQIVNHGAFADSQCRELECMSVA